jgi:signal transduction histidine kinase
MEIVAPAFRPTVARTLSMPRTNVPMEVALVHKDGTIRYVEYVASDIEVNEKKRRIIGMRDIEDRLALEREIVNISERERTRIGYDLHDDVGQILASAKWSATRLAKELDGTQSAARQNAGELVELIDKSITRVKQVSSRLAPQVLKTPEIYPALSMLASDVNEHTGLRCTLHCSRQEDFDVSDATIQLFRIAEEGVTNALKHSQGSSIDLFFGRRDDSYVLEVLDDGIGIPDEGKRVEGVGLRSIRYRARLVHGSVDIDRRSEGGTRLACTFPA